MSSVTKQLLAAFTFRHACKSFDASATIPAEDFATILEVGRLSPSSFGFEPWQFLVIENKSLREELLPICWGAQGQLPTANYFVIILARKAPTLDPKGPYLRDTIMRKTKHFPDDIAEAYVEKFTAFMQDDFAYSGNERAIFEWAARQSYIALGNMMTAAAMLGIDSCPMEGFQKENVEQLLAKKGLMDNSVFGVACMVAFGKRENEPRPKTRRALEDVVQWVK